MLRCGTDPNLFAGGAAGTKYVPRRARLVEARMEPVQEDEVERERYMGTSEHVPTGARVC